MTLTVLKSRKPIFVLRSLKNCDCVRICLLISRSRRSSGTPASDLSSSAPLHSATRPTFAESVHPSVRQSDRCFVSRAHVPDVQVDRGLERKAVMRLQLDLGSRRTSAGIGREVVRTALIIDVICGLLRRRLRLRGQWLSQLLWLRLRREGRDGDGRRDGRGAGKRGAVYDFSLVRGGVVGGWGEERKETRI